MIDVIITLTVLRNLKKKLPGTSLSNMTASCSIIFVLVVSYIYHINGYNSFQSVNKSIQFVTNSTGQYISANGTPINILYPVYLNCTHNSLCHLLCHLNNSCTNFVITIQSAHTIIIDCLSSYSCSSDLNITINHQTPQNNTTTDLYLNCKHQHSCHHINFNIFSINSNSDTSNISITPKKRQQHVYIMVNCNGHSSCNEGVISSNINTNTNTNTILNISCKGITACQNMDVYPPNHEINTFYLSCYDTQIQSTTDLYSYSCDGIDIIIDDDFMPNFINLMCDSDRCCNDIEFQCDKNGITDIQLTDDMIECTINNLNCCPFSDEIKIATVTEIIQYSSTESLFDENWLNITTSGM